MTDNEETTDELEIAEEAKKIADNPPETEAAAADLPDDVQDGDLSEEEAPA